MNDNQSKHDETESVGGPMIRLQFAEWIMTPQFAYLDDAPLSEAETCETLSPDAVALERHEVRHQNETRFTFATFASFDEFKHNLVAKELLFFHVFHGTPSDDVLRLLSEGKENERVLLLDVAKDRGFLNGTPITVTSDRKFVSKPLAEMRGVGAWAKGAFFGFEEKIGEIASFISKARAFARSRP